MVTLEGERIYLAGRFDRQAELRDAAVELIDAGAVIVSTWLGSPAALGPFDVSNATSHAEGLAVADLRDMGTATMCIAFSEEPDAPQGRGGRHVELGLAIARGLKLVLIGPREHVFHCLKQVEQYDSWEDFRVAAAMQRPDALAVR